MSAEKLASLMEWGSVLDPLAQAILKGEFPNATIKGEEKKMGISVTTDEVLYRVTPEDETYYFLVEEVGGEDLPINNSYGNLWKTVIYTEAVDKADSMSARSRRAISVVERKLTFEDRDTVDF